MKGYREPPTPNCQSSFLEWEHRLSKGEFYILTEEDFSYPDWQKPMQLIEQHKKFIAWYQEKLGMSDYGLLWFFFFKGVVITLLIERLIFHR